MYQILLIEDDVQICEVIKDYFERESEGKLRVLIAYDGERGLKLFSETKCDIVLLDIMLPDIDGFDICREMRLESYVPILFLTGRSTENDIVRGYRLGCDDYIIKPFSMVALYSKCMAVLKRDKGIGRNSEMICGKLSINPFTYVVKNNGTEIKLAPKEFELLCMLMENKNYIVSREKLLVEIWGYDYDGSDRCVDNHIRKLRKHLGDAGRYIKTVTGKGYQIKESV